MANGRYDELLALSPVNLDEVGESELMTWFVALGIMGTVPGKLLTYQELSHHGHGVVQFLPPLPPAPEWVDRECPRTAGTRSPQTDYEYYRFPDPSSLELNRLLHRIIIEADYRAEFVRDRDTVLARRPCGPRSAQRYGTARASTR